MSINSDLSRIQTAKSGLASKIPASGLISTYPSQIQDIIDDANATTGETDTTLADAVGTLIDGYGHGGSGGIVITDTVDAAGGTIREITAQEISGTLSITQNGTYDVTQYASAEVDVSGGGGIDWDDFVSGDWPTGVITLNTTTQIVVNNKFYNMREITSVNASNITNINADSAFRGCSKLEVVNFPLLATAPKGYCFGDCPKLQGASFPSLTSTGSSFLNSSCYNSTSDNVILVFPKLTSVNTDCFRSIRGDAIIDLGPDCASLGTRAIYNFDFTGILILRRDSIVTCSTNTSIGAITTRADATIYIPKSLYDHLGDGSSLDYKSATNWSTADGYGVITWAAIEGSQYENAYADGTPIT